jgi:bla regulator protein BlaR1
MFPQAAEPEDLFFWTPKFTLVFQDYNQDGQVDFNLGQYASSNGNLYRLFTLRPDGTIEQLPRKGDTEGLGFFVSPLNRRNSSPLIRADKGLLKVPYYDNTRGRSLIALYRWNGQVFVPVSN